MSFIVIWCSIKTTVSERELIYFVSVLTERFQAWKNNLFREVLFRFQMFYLCFMERKTCVYIWDELREKRRHLYLRTSRAITIIKTFSFGDEIKYFNEHKMLDELREFTKLELQLTAVVKVFKQMLLQHL